MGNTQKFSWWQNTKNLGLTVWFCAQNWSHSVGFWTRIGWTVSHDEDKVWSERDTQSRMTSVNIGWNGLISFFHLYQKFLPSTPRLLWQTWWPGMSFPSFGRIFSSRIIVIRGYSFSSRKNCTFFGRAFLLLEKTELDPWFFAPLTRINWLRTRCTIVYRNAMDVLLIQKQFNSFSV